MQNIDQELLEKLLERNAENTPKSQSSNRNQPQRNHRAARQHTNSISVMAVSGTGMLFGLLTWPIGAKYTIDGIIWCVNWLLRFLTFEYQIEMFTDLYLYLLPIPIAFSAVEWAGRRNMVNLHWSMIIVLSFVWVLDMVTTFTGLSIQLGWWVAFPLAAVLTFIPELIIKNSLHVIKTHFSTLLRRYSKYVT
jgi:hypothetical protein